jgi:glycosyltransferase involved in cell wall biosynthesis
MKIAIIIPAYQASETLPKVIASLPEELALGGGKAIIVNDGSPDETGEVADSLAEEHLHVVAVHNAERLGYGGALKKGFAHGYDLGCEIFPVVHSNGGEAPLIALALCVPIIEGKHEIVQGSVLKGRGVSTVEMPASHFYANRALAMFENLMFGTRMVEFHSGYMVYSRRLLDMVPYQQLQDNYAFDAEMILMAHLAGMACAEVPIPSRQEDGTSSLEPLPPGISLLKMMARYNLGYYRKILDQHTAANGTHGLN